MPILASRFALSKKFWFATTTGTVSAALVLQLGQLSAISSHFSMHERQNTCWQFTGRCGQLQGFKQMQHSSKFVLCCCWRFGGSFFSSSSSSPSTGRLRLAIVRFVSVQFVLF